MGKSKYSIVNIQSYPTFSRARKRPRVVLASQVVRQRSERSNISYTIAFSRDDLLQRCLGGHSLNANKSFNATFWRLTPKHPHSGCLHLVTYIWILDIVEISTYIIYFIHIISTFLYLMNGYVLIDTLPVLELWII